MKTYLWMAALVVGAAPAWAQPNNVGAMAPSDAIAVAEFERAIGGRTTLALKFKDLTTEEVSAQIAKSSALPFSAPLSSPFGRVILTNPPGAAANPLEVAKWNGDVDNTDFWSALRQWGRAENVRLQREREMVQKRQNEEKTPEHPKPAAGETEIAPAVMAQWQKKQMKWSQRRMAELQRFDPNRTLSASYDANAAAWRLSPSSQLISGRAFSAWPCLVLATGFQRQQSLSIQEAEPQEKEADKEAVKVPEKATATAVTAPVVNNQGQEVVAGGTLSDSLTLNLLVYAEPKLLERAKMRVQLNEARDDEGEDLLPAPEQNWRPSSSMSVSGSYGGGDGGISYRIKLRPRQAKGQKLAVLHGIVEIRYPMKLQEHEIASFGKPQDFSVNTEDLPTQGQFEPPHLENGQLNFSTSVKVESNRGGQRAKTRFDNHFRTQNFSIGGGPLGSFMLPSDYTFIDNQGRTWRAGTERLQFGFSGPDGRPIPITSPPTPPPDNFTYTEKHSGSLRLLSPDPATPNAQVTLTPDELAKVRFTKATFTTESDWRTLEVPFEFHDLPLPPR